jgi:hypothetical protein
MAHPGPEIPQKSGNSLRLAYRDGAWCAGERRYGSYREALKQTLLAAEIELPRRFYKGPPGNPPRLRTEALEARPWWPAFLEYRKAKLAAHEAARAEKARRRAMAEGV